MPCISCSIVGSCASRTRKSCSSESNVERVNPPRHPAGRMDWDAEFALFGLGYADEDRDMQLALEASLADYEAPLDLSRRTGPSEPVAGPSGLCERASLPSGKVSRIDRMEAGPSTRYLDSEGVWRWYDTNVPYHAPTESSRSRGRSPAPLPATPTPPAAFISPLQSDSDGEYDNYIDIFNDDEDNNNK